MSYILRELVQTVEQLKDALEKSNERFERLGNKVEEWIASGQNEALPESTRATYLSCAEDVIAIMTRDL